MLSDVTAVARSPTMGRSCVRWFWSITSRSCPSRSTWLLPYQPRGFPTSRTVYPPAAAPRGSSRESRIRDMGEG
jgi:hypothetical protein